MTATRCSAPLAWTLVATAVLTATGRVRAQTDVSSLAAWLHEPTAAAAEASLRQCLAELAPGERSEYLRVVAQALVSDPPAAVRADVARRCVRAHAPLLAELAATQAPLCEWFVLYAANFLAFADGPEGALATLAEADRLVPGATALLVPRRLLEVDCLVAQRQLLAADRRCAELERFANAPLDAAALLQRRGTIEVMLGRLDAASGCLDAAARLLDALPPERSAERRDAELQLLLRRLDLMTANERFAAVGPAVRRFAAQRERDGAPLDGAQRTLLRLHEVGADYLAAQHQLIDVDAAAAAVESLRTSPELPARERDLCTIWLADLELARGDLARARSLLAVVEVSRRDQWLTTAIAARLARRSAAHRDVLLAHETQLRAELHALVEEWREAAAQRGSAGFLRLGPRLRTLAELIAVTDLLHGPERALADVLTVQACTAVSRARGARAQPVAELRRRLFTDGDGALVFVPAWDTSHVFAVDRTEVLRCELPRASAIRQLAANVRVELGALDAERVAEPTLAAVRAHATALADALLPAQLRQRMRGWRHVVITGGNLLGNPPFACLPWDERTLLGERFGVARIASLPLLERLHADASATAAAAALPARLVATLTPTAEFAGRNALGAPVALAGARWQRLLDELPAGSTCAVDRDATPAAVLADGPARLTIVLAHGEQPSLGAEPALGLAADPRHRDGALTAADVRSSRQRGVVVIAACHASRGPLRMGDDDAADSLADAFLVAGATAVVASAAPLRASLHLDAAAALLHALTAGANPAEALRRARVAIGGSDDAQRYRAAQLELLGVGTVPLVEAPAEMPLRAAWWWVLAASVLVAGAAVARSRRRGSGCSRPPCSRGA